MKIALWQEAFVPALVAEALRLINEDKRLCDAIAKAGSALVKPGSRLLTPLQYRRAGNGGRRYGAGCDCPRASGRQRQQRLGG